MTYDEQIKYLTENPNMIQSQWGLCQGLFKRIGITNRSGCLTEIKSAAGRNIKHITKDKDGIKVEYTIVFGAYLGDVFYDHDLTEKIQKDSRIPSDPYNITVEMLPAFKEWQERIDKQEKTIK